MAWAPEVAPVALMGCVPVWPPGGTVPTQVKVPSLAAVAEHTGTALEAWKEVPNVTLACTRHRDPSRSVRGEGPHAFAWIRSIESLRHGR